MVVEWQRKQKIYRYCLLAPLALWRLCVKPLDSLMNCLYQWRQLPAFGIVTTKHDRRVQQNAARTVALSRGIVRRLLATFAAWIAGGQDSFCGLDSRLPQKLALVEQLLDFCSIPTGSIELLGQALMFFMPAQPKLQHFAAARRVRIRRRGMIRQMFVDWRRPLDQRLLPCNHRLGPVGKNGHDRLPKLPDCIGSNYNGTTSNSTLTGLRR